MLHKSSDFFDSRILRRGNMTFYPDALPRFSEMSGGQDQRDRKPQLVHAPAPGNRIGEDDLSVRACVET